jgi:hypothetical protein
VLPVARPIFTSSPSSAAQNSQPLRADNRDLRRFPDVHVHPVGFCVICCPPRPAGEGDRRDDRHVVDRHDRDGAALADRLAEVAHEGSAPRRSNALIRAHPRSVVSNSR